MSTKTNQSLARLLDTPLLARVVPHLAPETLHGLIQHYGLDACGELVTAATAAQLTSVLDLDLWRPTQPGRDEDFDADRFGEWLDVLVEAGESAAARTIASLDANVVIAGLSRYLRVFDPGTFEPTASSDDEAIDRRELMNSETGADVLECEVGGYLVRARRTDAWDAIVTLLVTLDVEHHDCFHALMTGCRRLSNSLPEVDGLDSLLTTSDQHLHEAAIEREQRRSRQGYATAADARAFLQMARHSASIGTNPIVAAYFRAAEDPVEDASKAPAISDEDISPSIDTVVELLAEAGVMAKQPRALLEAAGEEPTTKLGLLRRLMGFLLDENDPVYFTRSSELAFLANTLLAGSSVQSRALTPGEASDAAACICNLGLECWPSRWPPAPSQRLLQALETSIAPDRFLNDHSLVTAFEVGWSVLYEDVSLFAADRLIATLADVRCADADTARGLVRLQRRLVKQREGGAPWLARDAADVLATLDATAWIGVLGLLNECPIVPAALTAVVERRTTSISPTAFEFVSTSAQIGDVRRFLSMLPDLLSP